MGIGVKSSAFMENSISHALSQRITFEPVLLEELVHLEALCFTDKQFIRVSRIFNTYIHIFGGTICYVVLAETASNPTFRAKKKAR